MIGQCNLRVLPAAAAVLLLPPVFAAPPASLDYPLTWKTRWTYHMRQELGAGVHFGEEDAKLAHGSVLDTKMVSEALGSDQIGGVSYVRVESRRSGRLWLTEWLRVAPEGLLLRKTIDSEQSQEVLMSPPQKLLSATLRPGESWDWKQSTAPVSSRTTVGATQEVIAPAGTYKAVPVEIETTFVTEGEPLKVRQTRWFAPGVGFVKQDTTASVAGHMLSHTVLTLEKFEPATGH